MEMNHMEKKNKNENEIKAREVKRWRFPEDGEPQGTSRGYITVFPSAALGKGTHTQTQTHQPKAIRTEEITGGLWTGVFHER